MSEEDKPKIKSVEYKILSINEERGVANVRFTNPFKTGKDDSVNVDTEREIIIPIDDKGVADAEEFKARLLQHSYAQYNKMEIGYKASINTTKKNAFADILKMDKGIEIVNDPVLETEVLKEEPTKEAKTSK